MSQRQAIGIDDPITARDRLESGSLVRKKPDSPGRPGKLFASWYGELYRNSANR
jgi:hypothetical protein